MTFVQNINIHESNSDAVQLQFKACNDLAPDKFVTSYLKVEIFVMVQHYSVSPT